MEPAKRNEKGRGQEFALLLALLLERAGEAEGWFGSFKVITREKKEKATFNYFERSLPPHAKQKWWIILLL